MTVTTVLRRFTAVSKEYGEIYKRPSLYWGSEPSELVRRFAEMAPQGKALDLGMGEGRNALYLASIGFQVTGVELAQSGVVKCERLAAEKNLKVKSVWADARDFKIAKGRYSLIIALGLIQFMTKTDAQKLIWNAAEGLKKGGLFLCVTFTVDDPSYKTRKRRSREIAPGVFLDATGSVFSLYHHGELLTMSCPGLGKGEGSLHSTQSHTVVLRPIYYSEYDFYDARHAPPHWHGVAEFVGKKT